MCTKAWGSDPDVQEEQVRASGWRARGAKGEKGGLTYNSAS